MPARAFLLLVLGLAIGSSVGCASFLGLPLKPMSEDASGSASAQGNLAKRQPQPATCVALGDLHEKAATEPGRSPAEQEELRNKARLSYQQALQISPQDLPALMALARLYNSEDDFERAVATFERAVAAHPKNPAPRYELGMCQARRKNWDAALQSLQKAVELDPENRAYRHTYGLCLARAQRYDESFAVLTKLDGPAAAHYDLARMLHHLGQDEASKEHLRLALAQKPDHFGAQQLLLTLQAGTAEPVYPGLVEGTANQDAAATQAALGRPVHVVHP